ncbi:MAG: hypothetical protein PHE29_07915, partial [Tissierellia bacterium]|nr:hypothetical protein [Tissierellia bacterium]
TTAREGTPVPADAKGTGGHKGGLAVVGEKGREIAILPNSKIVLLGKDGKSQLVNLPKGTQVIPNDETEDILKETGSNIINKKVPKYANGTGETIPHYAGGIVGAIGIAIGGLIGGAISNVTGTNKKLKDTTDNLNKANKQIGKLTNKIDDLSDEVVSLKNNTKDLNDEIPKNNFVATISNDFKKGKGQYSTEKYVDFEGYDDYLKERKIALKEISKLQKDYLEGTNQQITQEEILAKIDAQMVKDARTQSWMKLDLLKQLKANNAEYSDELKEQLDNALDSGNTELATKLHEAYNDSLRDQISLEEQINSAIQQRYEIEFALMEKKLDKQNELMEEMEYQMSLKDILNPDDVVGISNLYQEMSEHTSTQVSYLYEVLDQLQEQISLLEVGSYEWQIIDGQINTIIGKIRSANLEIAQMAKTAFSGFANAFKDNVLGANPRPEDYNKPEDDSDKWLEGLEKQLEIEKLMKYVEENKLELNEKQLEVINEQGRIRKKELDVVRKELELQQLLVKIENLRNQKTIQQLTKKEDGTWDFEYVADMDAINEVEDQILDARLDVIHAEKALRKELADEVAREREKQLKASQDAYDNKIKRFEEVLKNAENRMYKTAEEFRLALASIGLEYAEGWLDEAVDEYWKYFTKTAEIFTKEALEKTKQALRQQSKAFEKIGNENGKKYADGLLANIDEIMSGEGDIIAKQKAIIDMLSSQYAEFALAGNKNGMSFINGLISSMETIDYENSNLNIPKQIVDMIISRANDLEKAGNSAGSALLKGLADSIKSSTISEQLKLLSEHVTGEVEKYLGGNSQGFEKSFIKYINRAIEATLSSGQIGDMYKNIDDALKQVLRDLSIAEDSGISLFREQLSNAIINKDSFWDVINGSGLDEINDLIIGILDEANKYGTLGQALGEEFMNGLINVFTNMSTEMQGEGEGAISEAINAITNQLDAKIMEFAEKGDLQGVAYAEALKDKLAIALLNAELTQEDIIAILNEYKDFDLAGLLSGDAYNQALELGLIDAEKTTDESSSAIVSGLEEDVENFGKAGTAQGEAYENAITSAFERAVKSAKSIIGDLVEYINLQNFSVDVGVKGNNLEGIQQFDTGGYTGNFSGGKLAVLHEKELVLNKLQTKDFSTLLSNMPNLIKGIDVINNLVRNIGSISIPATKESGDQVFHIDKLEFPNVHDSKDIEDAILNLPRIVKQKLKTT